MLTTGQTLRERSLLEGIRIGVHDIRSPITFLRILQNSAINLSPREKNLLEIATERIVNVIESMDKLLQNNFANKVVKPVNLSSLIEKIIIEKEYEYKHLDIKFSYILPTNHAECLIQNENGDLERMLSNLLNNVVDACDENKMINISLELKNKILYLNIIDSGRGIPDEVLHKLRNGISVTFGKENGHGIGFQQIRNTVTNLQGNISVDTKLGAGSNVQIILSACS
ncbi:MAG: hypothetical protein K0R49_788 [Burkholderiales bacterium]|jgi:signal transduction histidine kinase|nr:hypothetical protein [Burkholderiales bacterium]